MSPEQLTAIRLRLDAANDAINARISSTLVHAWYSADIAALLAEVERLQELSDHPWRQPTKYTMLDIPADDPDFAKAVSEELNKVVGRGEE